MKVALINHSDVLGGASVVSLRLVEALAAAGVDATMVVGHKLGDSPLVVEGSQMRRRLAFMAEHLDILRHNHFDRRTMFKISTCRYGMGLDRLEAVRRADVVVLAWINQATMSFDEIRALHAMGKPIVWIMHDRWNGTGVCHHVPDGCHRLPDQCGKCPLLRSQHSNDLSRRVFIEKLGLYGRVPITFVAVSRWLAGQCLHRGPLHEHHIEVIPNAFPIDRYKVTPQGDDPLLPASRHLIIMGAARLDDPVKNLPLAIDALNLLADRYNDITAVFFGDVRDKSAFDRLRCPHIHPGPIADASRVADIMARGQVVISTSRFETLPTTIIEGMAAGCVPVTTGHGGQADIIDGAPAGYIDHTDTPAGIADAIGRALDLRRGMSDDQRLAHRLALHDHIAARFGAASVARRYIDLFERLLKKQQKTYS